MMSEKEINKNLVNEVIESILLSRGKPVVWEIDEQEHKAVIEELKNRGWRQENDRKV